MIDGNNYQECKVKLSTTYPLESDTCHDLDGGEDDDSVEALDVRIRNKGTKEGEEAKCGEEVCGSGGGILDAHVHCPEQVAH